MTYDEVKEFISADGAGGVTQLTPETHAEFYTQWIKNILKRGWPK